MGEAVAFYTTEHRSIAAPIIRARVVELVDTRDLKSRGSGRVRAGSSPAPGTKIGIGMQIKKSGRCEML
jgi:hypothetical protein